MDLNLVTTIALISSIIAILDKAYSYACLFKKPFFASNRYAADVNLSVHLAIFTSTDDLR